MSLINVYNKNNYLFIEFFLLWEEIFFFMVFLLINVLLVVFECVDILIFFFELFRDLLW